MLPINEFALNKDVIVIGHRGASDLAPENTLSSFQHALDAGVDMIEVDVQVTADNMPIAMHDLNQGRTTDGDSAVKDMSYKDILKLDAGKWFGSEFSGEKVPLLSEVIDLINGKAYLNIEIKAGDQSLSSEKIHKIIDTVAECNYLDFSTFGSFDYKVLAEIKKYNPSIYTAAIKIPWENFLPSQICGQIEAEIFICSLGELTPEIEADAIKHNIILGVYDVDSKEDFKQVSEFKVKAIASNNPALIKELLESSQI
jgi:glycerophosphoryl diester phosphodiesterase